ncbi:cuticle protein-like [Uranotaenia lowii]|uniref:cuticle protein-like n=1 Tax=Uranotaenia lowii TaxID=190385 RepID=UPI002478CB2C|nr:cuticle protein-like [Uranotaenia lowii]
MAFKFGCLCALLAVAQAGVISSPGLAYTASAPLTYSAPLTKTLVAAPVQKQIIAEAYNTNPQYSFSYGVSDAVTGDQKSQQESRNGDVVQGAYSLIEPDGTKRTVQYTADAYQGFNAVVSREPLNVKTIATAPVIASKSLIAQPAIAKTVIAQPAYASYSTPLASKTIVSQPAYASYSTPVAKTYVSQPAYASYATPLATKTVVSQPAYASYSAPLAKTFVSQPAYATYAAPLATKTIVSQPGLASYASSGTYAYTN